MDNNFLEDNKKFLGHYTKALNAQRPRDVNWVAAELAIDALGTIEKHSRIFEIARYQFTTFKYSLPTRCAAKRFAMQSVFWHAAYCSAMLEAEQSTEPRNRDELMKTARFAQEVALQFAIASNMRDMCCTLSPRAYASLKEKLETQK